MVCWCWNPVKNRCLFSQEFHIFRKKNNLFCEKVAKGHMRWKWYPSERKISSFLVFGLIPIDSEVKNRRGNIKCTVFPLLLIEKLLNPPDDSVWFFFFIWLQWKKSNSLRQTVIFRIWSLLSFVVVERKKHLSFGIPFCCPLISISSIFHQKKKFFSCFLQKSFGW